jgi:hypothetical protein
MTSSPRDGHTKLFLLYLKSNPIHPLPYFLDAITVPNRIALALLAREKKIQRTSQSSLPFRLLLPYFPLPLLDFLVADPVQLPIVNSPTCVTQATATHARSLEPWPISIFPNRPQSFAELPGKGRWEKAKFRRGSLGLLVIVDSRRHARSQLRLRGNLRAVAGSSRSASMARNSHDLIFSHALTFINSTCFHNSTQPRSDRARGQAGQRSRIRSHQFSTCSRSFSNLADLPPNTPTNRSCDQHVDNNSAP